MMKKSFSLRSLLTPTALVASLVLSGCASLNPEQMDDKRVRDRAAADRASMFDQQEPIAGPVSMDEAIARALKYNLDMRLKKMEVAVSAQLKDLAKYDMLPNLVAGAGYANRSNYAGGSSWQFSNQTQGAAPSAVNQNAGLYSTSSERTQRMNSVEFSWNVLDFGVSYYRAKQKADEFLIAQERRRRVVQTMVHDVRFAYLRAMAAQRLAQESESVMQRAERAIEQSRAAEMRGAIPLQTALAYQRALIDAVALLNLRRQDLDFAKAELSALMSSPTQAFTLVETPDTAVPALPADLAVLEDTALMNRPELREEDYRKRISGDETRRQLMSVFPNLSFGLGSQFDSNRLLYNNDWVDTSARVSWNLLRVLSAPDTVKAGERQQEVDDARRQALSMAVMTQMRIAALRFGLAKSDLDLAQKSLAVDDRVAAVAKAGVSSRTETELELIRADARAMVSRYQHAIAYANAQAAFARVQHSLGQDFDFGNADTAPIAQAIPLVAEGLKRAEQSLPTPMVVKIGQRPKVRLFMEPSPTGQPLLAGVAKALALGGFDVVQQDQPEALQLQVRLSLRDGQAGLKRSEVSLTEVGKSSVLYTATVSSQPRDEVYRAIGEAAVTANLGYLREWIAGRKP